MHACAITANMESIALGDLGTEDMTIQLLTLLLAIKAIFMLGETGILSQFYSTYLVANSSHFCY